MIRRYDLDMPKELDERFKKAMAAEQAKGVLPASVGPRDFILALFMQGLAMLEVQQKERERGTKLVMTPEEAAEISKRLQALRG